MSAQSSDFPASLPASSRYSLYPQMPRNTSQLTCSLQEVPDAHIHRGYAATQCLGALKAERPELGEGVAVDKQGKPKFCPHSREEPRDYTYVGTGVTHLQCRLSAHLPPPPAVPAYGGHCPSPGQGQHQ